MEIKKIIIILLISYTSMGCKEYDPGFDYRNFDGTPVVKLAKAVQNDDIKEINRLVKEEKMDLNYQEKKYGSSVLNLAVINQNIKTIESLLILGANPNLKGIVDGRSAFLDILEYTYPARTCEVDKIKLLIKYGADVNALSNDTKNSRVNTALMIACSNGCIDVVKTLVENGADVNKYTYFEGYGAITEALIMDNIEIVKYLVIDKKATIPKYVFKREANINYIGEPETKLTITKMLQESDYINDPIKQKNKDEILEYLKSINKS